MPRDKRDVEAALRQKGFRQSEGDHHWFIYHTAAGLKSRARTKTSHGSHRQLSDDVLAKMARQCKLNKSQFLELVDCPLARLEYEELLRQQGDL